MSLVQGGHRDYVPALENDAALDGLEAALWGVFPRASAAQIDQARAAAERYAGAVMEAQRLAGARDAAAELAARRREPRRG